MQPRFGCSWPNAIELNEWFTIDCSSRNVPKPINVKIEKDARIECKPPNQFTVKPGEVKFLDVRIKRTRSGIVSLGLHPDRGLGVVDIPLAVGFQGHLKITPSNLSLSDDDPATINIMIVDENGKPLTVGTTLEMNVQAVDALVRQDTNNANGWSEKLPPMALAANAGMSPQFQVRSNSKRGGSIHILATLNFPNDGVVLAQESFAFQVAPVWWLPIVFAAVGSLLYWLYSFLQAPKASVAVFAQVGAALLGGVIAYLFAGFDLLGLKLDPNVLKTYVLLGFLFGYVGIEVILAKRFRRVRPVPHLLEPPALPQSKRSTSKSLRCLMDLNGLKFGM
jgi:hypothetical protein